MNPVKYQGPWKLVKFTIVCNLHDGPLSISSGAQKNDVNVRDRQENWQWESFAWSQQKDMNDKTPTI